MLIKYFASEIKPQAIKVTQLNFPNTIQTGSILDVNAIDLPQIDLLKTKRNELYKML